MSEFEVLTIPLSLILGLGVTRILGAIADLIRGREQCTVHWVPLVWSGSVLTYCIGFFFILYDLTQRSDAWTWVWYGPVLVQTMLVFLSAGLVLPRSVEAAGADLLADFQRHGRLSLVPLAILLGTGSWFNVLQGGVWIHPGNGLNLLLTGLLVVAFFRLRQNPASVLTAMFAALTGVGWIFLWARPGD